MYFGIFGWTFPLSVLHLFFAGGDKVCAIVRAALTLAFWTAAEPAVTSAQMLRSDHTKRSSLMRFFVELNTRKVSSSKHQAPSVFWCRGRPSWLSGLWFPCPFLSPSRSLTSAGCFCWAGFPIVHTLSWLASQGCCWLLGPLIGSSCALAFPARLGLACARSSLLYHSRYFGRNFDNERKSDEVQQQQQQQQKELHQNHFINKARRPHWQKHITSYIHFVVCFSIPQINCQHCRRWVDVTAAAIKCVCVIIFHLRSKRPLFSGS